jgi:hypothetical protein
MTQDPQLTLQTDDPDDVRIFFPADGVEVTLPITVLEEGVVRIEAVPLMVEGVNYRDVIRVKRRTKLSLEFVCVLEPSDWRTYSIVLSTEFVDSPVLEQFTSRLHEMGCYWERDFVGLLLIGVPPDLDIDPMEVLAEIRASTQQH